MHKGTIGYVARFVFLHTTAPHTEYTDKHDVQNTKVKTEWVMGPTELHDLRSELSLRLFSAN